MKIYFIGYSGMALAMYRSLKCLTEFIPTQGFFISTMRPQDLKRVLHPCPHFDLTLLDLLHKSEKGEACAEKNPDFTDQSGRKCFAPTAKN